MPQLIATVPNFSQTSTWKAIADPVPTFTTPTTDTDNKDFDISGIPAGATINSAVITAVYGSPLPAWIAISENRPTAAVIAQLRAAIPLL